MPANSFNQETIADNFSQRIAQNAYPGRGIILGRSAANHWVQVYWIMGRSENSRNRVFEEKEGLLQTKAAHPAKVADPSLLIYNAMREAKGVFIVTNGVQTDAIAQGFEQGSTFEEALSSQVHEPDAPNFTPRISGYLDLRQNQARVMLSIIKASPFDTEHSEHSYFHYQTIAPGYGYAITTYQQDGNPLPSFEGSPFLVPLKGEASQIAQTYWEALNEANKIALAVKNIDSQTQDSETMILNKYHSKTE